MENNLIKLKLYQLLAEIQKNMLNKIQREARNNVEYLKDNDKSDNAILWMEYISNPAKWEYSSILSKEDKKLLETIEYLLDDDADKICRYSEWKPTKF